MIRTPYYLVDKAGLQRNLRVAAQLREWSGARILLALKCFATWPVFDLMREHLDGTTSSSLYELRLGREKFGGETHAYSVAWSDDDIPQAVAYADKIIFNSISQLERYHAQAKGVPCGLRINPSVSAAAYDLADPARPYSRLGEPDPERIAAVVDRLDGFMIHNNCENRDFGRFDELLTRAEERFGDLFERIRWISLGGGIHFTAPGYPLQDLGRRLRAFSERYGVQVYLEPGESIVQDSATLEVTVLDTQFNGKPIAVVDAATEAHMLDLLIYRQNAKVAPDAGPHSYMVCGKSCLAGDIFGEFRFGQELRPGDRISIQDAAGYTMVKKNWFNGVRMPSIVLREQDGSLKLIREFSFEDYLTSLS